MPPENMGNYGEPGTTGRTGTKKKPGLFVPEKLARVVPVAIRNETQKRCLPVFEGSVWKE